MSDQSLATLPADLVVQAEGPPAEHKPWTFYLRDAKRIVQATIVALPQPTIRVGFAVKSRRDEPSPKRGRTIALGRAEKFPVLFSAGLSGGWSAAEVLRSIGAQLLGLKLKPKRVTPESMASFVRCFAALVRRYPQNFNVETFERAVAYLPATKLLQPPPRPTIDHETARRAVDLFNSLFGLPGHDSR